MGLAEAAEEVSATSPSKIAKGLSSSIASSTEVNLILSIIFSRGSVNATQPGGYPQSHILEYHGRSSFPPP